MSDSYLDFVTGHHKLYNRYYEDWRLGINSYWGGTEYKHAKYLRAYAVDMAMPGETINTYTTTGDGAVVAKHQARLQIGTSTYDTDKDTDLLMSNYYGEKLDNVPLFNYVKLIAAEYNAILFRNAPQRDLPMEDQDISLFLKDVDGEGNDINEFMSQVDIMTTVYGVCHVLCMKPQGSAYPKFKLFSPLDITNWQHRYREDGSLELERVSMLIEHNEQHSVYQVLSNDSIDIVFVGEDEDYEPPTMEGDVAQVDDRVYMFSQPNELGYIPLKTIYQNQRVYPMVGSTPIQDIAQIQRSVYGYSAEIYSAITYGTHPTLVIDENTDQLNDGQVGAEPGSVVRVQSSLTGESNYTYEFISPPLNAVSEIRELIDHSIEKLSQVAMLRTEDLIRSSRSGAQIEQYDDKLSAVIRKKATNMENAEYGLWDMWFDWQGSDMPEDLSITYNRQYNKRAIEQEVGDLSLLMKAISEYRETMMEPGEGDVIATEGDSCPPATQNVVMNTQNRDAAIQQPEVQYGPLNVDVPGDFWQQLADHWGTTEEAAKQSMCANCAAFDISERMKGCMPGETSDEDGELGYCWMHHFKCHSARSCRTWAAGGPITDDQVSQDWQQRSGQGSHTEDAQVDRDQEFLENARHRLRQRLDGLMQIASNDLGY